jgi:hypothetical protein
VQIESGHNPAAGWFLVGESNLMYGIRRRHADHMTGEPIKLVLKSRVYSSDQEHVVKEQVLYIYVQLTFKVT